MTDSEGCPFDLHVHTTCSDGGGTPWEVVLAATSRPHLEVLAITDHFSAAGRFVHASRGSPVGSIEEYVEECSRLARDAAERRPGFEVLTGLEVSEFPPVRGSSGSGGSGGAWKFPWDHLDWLMVDGKYVDDPVDRTCALSDQAHDEAQEPPAFAIAHPAYDDLDAEDLDALACRGVALELNEQKFCKADARAILQILESFSPGELSFSIGSDAHDVSDVGRCPIVWNFAVREGLRLVDVGTGTRRG
ncbi:MAG: hypothetical protein Kow0069_32770 [Promethearchaeota archaeon]